MTRAPHRLILRCIHIIFSIPILGYIYGPISQVQPYATAVRLVFVPVIILSGFWMYAGVVFALLGIALWLGSYLLAGYGAAVASQVALFTGRKVWLIVSARQAR